MRFIVGVEKHGVPYVFTQHTVSLDHKSSVWW